ncbi:hypothetical protein DPMN_113604 [Dreissena polymorpha]|uniref:Uncharacterized protein n=1 Tax=Dreissena polymorpha TaxID=45954 RepID=A0A9D4KII1_DREPO|nr:hypothetical protein DPMN_113604 [Dreissena polymorpha]
MLLVNAAPTLPCNHQTLPAEQRTRSTQLPQCRLRLRPRPSMKQDEIPPPASYIAPNPQLGYVSTQPGFVTVSAGRNLLPAKSKTSKTFWSEMLWKYESPPETSSTLPPLPPFEKRRNRILTGSTPISKTLNQTLRMVAT